MKPAQVKRPTPPDLLDQIDVRVGTILTRDRCSQFRQVDRTQSQLRRPQRTVLVGMKQEQANPREIEGKQALFVLNFAPRKMAGMVSEGMLFDIGYSGGITPVLAVPETHVPDGTGAG